MNHSRPSFRNLHPRQSHLDRTLVERQEDDIGDEKDGDLGSNLTGETMSGIVMGQSRVLTMVFGYG